MRYGLVAFAIPTGILTCAPQGGAQVFLTEEQALRSVFGSSQIDRQDKVLTDSDRQTLAKSTGLRFSEPSVRFLVAERDQKTLGYAVVMNEIGKSEPITFMVVVSPEQRVSDVLVMTFRESRGGEVREQRFLRQFKGKHAGNAIAVNNDIINYSGATLSSKAIARGVKRALGLVKHFYAVSKTSATAPPAFMLPVSQVPGSAGVYRQIRYLMGTLCEIRLEAPSSAHAMAAVSAAFSEIRRLEKIFSAYDPDSELSCVNRQASDSFVPVSRDLWPLMKAARRYARATAGAVDATLGSGLFALDPGKRAVRFTTPGMAMDFGGLAKGYAASRVVNVLAGWGISSALVNLGGSSIATMPDGREWLVGVADPACPEQYAAVIAARPGTSISCSGVYERSHIVDPRSRRPITGLRSAVAVTRSPLLGEVLSKSLLLNTHGLAGHEYLRLSGSENRATVVESNVSDTTVFI